VPSLGTPASRPAFSSKGGPGARRSQETAPILLAREAHFPATIADLYDPETMPADLRAAHERNDETLERIYLGRRFKNDTERLEKLFALYTEMTAKGTTTAKAAPRRKKSPSLESGSPALASKALTRILI
jgi:hypothetical protein